MVFLEQLRGFVSASEPSSLPNQIKAPEEVLEDTHAEMEKLLKRSRAAQIVLESYTQEQVDRLIKAVTWSCCEQGVATQISSLAVEESKLGNFEGKYAKMFSKARAALFDIAEEKSVGVIEDEPERQIIKIAKPIGVIFAVVPCTNPEATPVIKAINALKGRNSIILSPNSRTVYLNEFIVARMRLALLKMGAPQDLIIAVEAPGRAKTKYLLENADFNLVTGANSLVKAAYKSGTPSLGVGVGNAVVAVTLKEDEVDAIRLAAENIAKSKTFDHAASCSSDNSIISLKGNSALLLNELSKVGGFVLKNKADIEKVKKALFNVTTDAVKFRPEAIVRSASKLAELAGVEVPDDIKFFIIPMSRSQVGKRFPFSGEKLSPVLSFYTVQTLQEVIDLTNNIHDYQGKGHSCGIYSTNDTEIDRFALETRTARVMVNQPQSLSNSGALHNGMRQTLSLGCGTWGGNSTTENINWKNLVNITYVSRPLPQPKVLPSDEDLFGKEIMNLIDA